jgi:hypothetical protein
LEELDAVEEATVSGVEVVSDPLEAVARVAVDLEICGWSDEHDAVVRPTSAAAATNTLQAALAGCVPPIIVGCLAVLAEDVNRDVAGPVGDDQRDAAVRAAGPVEPST